jgi:hypothetical protein
MESFAKDSSPTSGRSRARPTLIIASSRDPNVASPFSGTLRRPFPWVPMTCPPPLPMCGGTPEVIGSNLRFTRHACNATMRVMHWLDVASDCDRPLYFPAGFGSAAYPDPRTIEPAANTALWQSSSREDYVCDGGHLIPSSELLSEASVMRELGANQKASAVCSTWHPRVRDFASARPTRPIVVEGIAALLLENPLYGHRRRALQKQSVRGHLPSNAHVHKRNYRGARSLVRCETWDSNEWEFTATAWGGIWRPSSQRVCKSPWHSFPVRRDTRQSLCFWMGCYPKPSTGMPSPPPYREPWMKPDEKSARCSK